MTYSFLNIQRSKISNSSNSIKIYFKFKTPQSAMDWGVLDLFAIEVYFDKNNLLIASLIGE